MIDFLRRLTTISSSDPDDARRRGLLSILLFGLIVISLIVLFIIGVPFLFGQGSSSPEMWVLFLSSFVFFLLASGIFALNRSRSGSLASWLFLVIFLAAISFADTPEQLVDGRSLYLFTMPVLIASFLLFSWASFVIAAACSIIILLLTPAAGGGIPNYFGMIGFFAIALVAWLASRGLEIALGDLRVLNRELDKRVEERTHELAAALSREFAEAGKNQAILDGIADGVIVFDPDGDAIVANPAVSRLLQMPREALLGHSMEEFVQFDSLSKSDGEMLLSLLRNPDKNAPSARFIWGKATLSATSALVLNTLGSSIGTVAVFRDFTREAEVEKMKNTFVAMVSHELRTPLNAILAYAEMLQEQVYGPINPKQANAAARIFSNSQRLLALVSDLLDQARIEAGKLKFHIEDFRPSDLIDAMRGVMDKPASDKGLNLLTEIDSGLPQGLRGDTHRLQQVLINLVNNAVKFTSIGKISVRLYCYDHENWAMDVTDTGPGIPPDALPFIFDTFRQVDGATTRQHGGVGLGLAIVKRLLELMGGSIRVSSTLGDGSTFTAIMPMNPPEIHGER